MPADNESGGGNVHPGSWVGDSVEEFKKLPTWGKLAIAGLFIVAVVVFIKMRQSAASTSASGTVGAASNGLGIPSGATDTTGYTAGMSGSNGSTPTPQPIQQGGGNPPTGTTPPTHTGGPAPTPRPHPPTPKIQTYTVVHGDTLSGIAARLHYQGGWQALYAKNKGVIGGNPNLILPGQKLTL